jgi:hypothetical protein
MGRSGNVPSVPLHALAGAERVFWEAGAEVAGGEGFEGAEAGGEQAGSQATLAEEAAQKVCGGPLRFARIALHTAGDEVAIGVAAGMHSGDDVVEAPGRFLEATQAVEASFSARRRALTG